MQNKIQMITPIVEMDGDEMARVLWGWIKDILIKPYIDLKCEYYDLGLLNRNDTDDEVTRKSAEATKRLGVAVKCATITPNKKRMEEYPQLKKMWSSPNATIRSALDGTVFRTPIVVDAIKPMVRSWKNPITIARHAYGDVYKAVEIASDSAGECFLSFKGDDGCEKTVAVYKSEGPAVFQSMHNTESSIRSFANACFKYAIETKKDLWFSSKDTISKTYDGKFREIFDDVYFEYKEEFSKLGIKYFYTLIDDAVARVMRSEGGFIWACKNYDGDVMSDMISSAFSSIAMMTSVLVSPNDCWEYEAAHGTVTKHYYRYLNGEDTSTNPVAMIFAWTGALRKRGELDGLEDLVAFADALEKACMDTINSGIMTADLSKLADEEGLNIRAVTSREFMEKVSERIILE